MKSERRREEQIQTVRMLRKIDPTGDVKAALTERRKAKRKRMRLLAAVTILLSAAAAWSAGSGVLGEGGVLKRNAAGEGSYIVSLLAKIRGDEIETQVTVSEQALSGEALEELFSEAAEELTASMLGENESTDRIEYDLTLPSETSDGLVTAQWAFDSYTVLSSDGSIQEDVPEEGRIVEVTLTMTYLEEQAEQVFSIRVYPAHQTAEEALEEALQEAIASSDAQTAQSEWFILPDEVDGASVSWSEPGQYLWLEVLLLGGAMILILHYEEREQLKRAVEKRDAQMLEDYALIVNQLALLLGAGMTVYGAWERIVTGYEAGLQTQAQPDAGPRRLKGGEQTPKRIAYEEMKVTYARIRGGESEGKAYEDFGRRCGLRPYLKLSAILSRNLKLGTAGITAQLLGEAQDAFEQRKALARQKGEEAGTKLLIPMMMLLGVVMAIVAVPGFLSF